MKLTHEHIFKKVLQIFEEKFEIANPISNVDLRETYEFDSIDAIELLVEIEKIIGFSLDQEQKKMAMDIRTIDQICEYIDKMAGSRA